MTRRNAQIFAVAVTAALAVGVAVWFLDDLTSHWHAAQPPAEYRDAGRGRGGSNAGGLGALRTDLSAYVFVSLIEADNDDKRTCTLTSLRLMPPNYRIVLEDIEPKHLGGFRDLRSPMSANDLRLAPKAVAQNYRFEPPQPQKTSWNMSFFLLADSINKEYPCL